LEGAVMLRWARISLHVSSHNDMRSMGLAILVVELCNPINLPSIIQTLRWDLVLAKGLMIDGEMVSKL
jgi:hypothetical protein